MANFLEQKVRYFLTSPYRGRENVRESLNQLRKFGRLALVGGMLRDIYLFGNAGFNSDLDFVIVPYDLEDFEKQMKLSGAKINRFGGFSLPPGKWAIDVWPLQRSWAHINGHVKLATINDLRKATFFNCDAIVYDLESSTIRTYQGYFDDLSRKVLEVNLEPNPNPVGSSVRALRYSIMKGFRWGPKLAGYVASTLDQFGWDYFIQREMTSFRTSYLSTLNHHSFNKALLAHIDRNQEALFDAASFKTNVQLRLPNIM